MKITKEMGRACLRELDTGIACEASTLATTVAMGRIIFPNTDTLATALALCAAISGVKPEDVE